MSWWVFLDRADIWVETPEVQMVKGVFLVAVIVGFVGAWVWSKWR